MTHQILTGYPIDLKLVAKRPGWILMNLQIPQARRLSALICFIAILIGLIIQLGNSNYILEISFEYNQFCTGLGINGPRLHETVLITTKSCPKKPLLTAAVPNLYPAY